MRKPKLRNYVVTEVVKYVVLAENEAHACDKVICTQNLLRGEVSGRSAELYKPVNIRKNVAECLG